AGRCQPWDPLGPGLLIVAGEQRRVRVSRCRFGLSAPLYPVSGAVESGDTRSRARGAGLVRLEHRLFGTVDDERLQHGGRGWRIVGRQAWLSHIEEEIPPA